MTRDTQAFPVPIEGLDVAAGLNRMDGDVSLYLILLRDFVATEKTAADAIRDALARSDLDTATRRAHTLKGLAGTFGATRLAPAAQALEAALRDRLPPAQLAAPLTAFSGALTALMDELEAKLPPEDEPEPVPDEPIDPQDLAAACHELAVLLAHSDVRAGRVLGAHSGLFRSAFGDDYRQLEEALHGFDFEDASAVLLAACRRNGIELPTP